MSKKPVEIVVVMDRSGSMGSMWEEAVGGFNAFVKAQQAVKGKANLTLALFDHEYELVMDSVKLKDVEPLSVDAYLPRGTTALLDAIGRSIGALMEKNPKKAIICIITDGHENSSHEYVRPQVKELIDKAEDVKNWEVIYLAANQDAFTVGAAMGVKAGKAMNFVATGKGVLDAYGDMNTRSTTYRS